MAYPEDDSALSAMVWVCLENMAGFTFEGVDWGEKISQWREGCSRTVATCQCIKFELQSPKAEALWRFGEGKFQGKIAQPNSL
jgi:hypothetical protein